VDEHDGKTRGGGSCPLTPIRLMNDEERQAFLFGIVPKIRELLSDEDRFILWVNDGDNQSHFVTNHDIDGAPAALRHMADNLAWAAEDADRMVFEENDA